MNVTQEEFQKARRIGKAIQLHLEQTGEVNVRSTDVYPILARQKLIEVDRHNGLHFRNFLRTLKNKNALNLIPQCTCVPVGDHTEWYFSPVRRSESKSIDNGTNEQSRVLNVPVKTKREIEELINDMSPEIDRLPKRALYNFTVQQQEIRKTYPRAYENWTNREVEILIDTFKELQSVDAVAKLLRRQPSAVKMRLESERIL